MENNIAQIIKQADIKENQGQVYYSVKEAMKFFDEEFCKKYNANKNEVLDEVTLEIEFESNISEKYLNVMKKNIKDNSCPKPLSSRGAIIRF